MHCPCSKLDFLVGLFDAKVNLESRIVVEFCSESSSMLRQKILKREACQANDLLDALIWIQLILCMQYNLLIYQSNKVHWMSCFHSVPSELTTFLLLAQT